MVEARRMMQLAIVTTLVTCSLDYLWGRQQVEAFAPPSHSTSLLLSSMTKSTWLLRPTMPSSFDAIHNLRLKNKKKKQTTMTMMMVDPMTLMDATTTTAMTTAMTGHAASFLPNVDVASSMLLSFTDQGQNLAGIFFQSSLLPYLLFLYFLAFRGNQIPAVSNFGFQFILLFVISTIPAGIISKSVYGVSLANTDYLHGAAELLLTVANVMIVLGLKEAMTKPEPMSIGRPRQIALTIAASVAALCVIGPKLFVTGTVDGIVTEAANVGSHTPFLFGLGDFPAQQVLQFPWVTHSEPINALSIPTWLIHFSSVLEYWIAMGLVWQFASTTGNERWKGLTWGMLPLHASGICACTYHVFYNAPSLQFLVTAQAGLTLLGNLTLCLAAYRIATSNGWSPQELIPAPNPRTNPQGLVADGLSMKPLTGSGLGNTLPLPGVAGWVVGSTTSNVDLALNLAAATIFLSYAVKYGSLGLDAPFLASPILATSIIVAIPGATAYSYYMQSKKERDDADWNPLQNLFSSLQQQQQGDGMAQPSPLDRLFRRSNGDQQQEGMGGPSLSMADIKKYGAAGTVAYILTELAFWLVAFPVAAVALYQSTGHWPDVVHDTTDRAAVFAFVFAGANIARLLVPLRLGAALALAPWVDDNLLLPIRERQEKQQEAKRETRQQKEQEQQQEVSVLSTTAEEDVTETKMTTDNKDSSSSSPMRMFEDLFQSTKDQMDSVGSKADGLFSNLSSKLQGAGENTATTMPNTTPSSVASPAEAAAARAEAETAATMSMDDPTELDYVEGALVEEMTETPTKENGDGSTSTTDDKVSELATSIGKVVGTDGNAPSSPDATTSSSSAAEEQSAPTETNDETIPFFARDTNVSSSNK